MIYNGNCLDVMKRIPSNTYSAIITDPPYAIDLLGKDWDKCLPDERYWKEALRIVKPGGIILAFGGSRTFHRLCVKIEDSGWIIKDMFLWLYSSAMPKSHNISKALDDHLGAEREDIVVSVSKTRNPKASGGGKEDKQGSRPYIDRAQKRGYHIMKSDKPVTEQAKLFYGYGTGFRPSHEPIIVAMKPLDTNYHENAIKHGVSGFDIQRNKIKNNDDPSRHPANVIIDPIIANQLKRIANADRYFYVTKPNKNEKGRFNNHPSVKPLQLMRYLIKIVNNLMIILIY